MWQQYITHVALWNNILKHIAKQTNYVDPSSNQTLIGVQVNKGAY